MPFSHLQILNGRVVKKHRKRKYYQREVQCLHLGKDHPFIPTIIGHYAETGNFYGSVIMEEAKYGDLCDFLEVYGPSEPVARYVAKSIVLVLQYLYNQFHISHRDVKLENMVVTADGIIQLIDFELSTTDEISSDSVGTLSYMTPAILLRRPYNPQQADVWSLGVSMFLLSVGHRPYAEPTARSQYVNDTAWMDYYLSLVLQKKFTLYWTKITKTLTSLAFKEFIECCFTHHSLDTVLLFDFLDTDFNRNDMLNVLKNAPYDSDDSTTLLLS